MRLQAYISSILLQQYLSRSHRLSAQCISSTHLIINYRFRRSISQHVIIDKRTAAIHHRNFKKFC